MDIEQYKKAVEKIDEMLNIGKQVEDVCEGIIFGDLKQTRFRLNNKIKLDEVLEHNTAINLGKFVGFGFKYGDFYIRNSELHNLLYDNIFGSYSGINEWFSDWFTKIVSPMLGCTNYSYSLGSFDLEDIVQCFKRFGKEWNSNKNQYEEITFFYPKLVDEQLEYCKECYDYLVELSKNEKFINMLDSFLENYFRILLGDEYPDTEKRAEVKE